MMSRNGAASDRAANASPIAAILLLSCSEYHGNNRPLRLVGFIMREA